MTDHLRISTWFWERVRRTGLNSELCLTSQCICGLMLAKNGFNEDRSVQKFIKQQRFHTREGGGVVRHGP